MRRLAPVTVVLVLGLGLLTAGCGAAPTRPAAGTSPVVLGHARAGALSVDQAWADLTPSMAGMAGMKGTPTAGAYAVIRNASGTPDRLVSVSSPDAGLVELHATVDRGGAEVMTRSTGLDVPAHGMARLQPAAYHLMVSGVRRSLRTGDHLRLVLRFRSGTVVALSVPLIDPTDRPGDG